MPLIELVSNLSSSLSPSSLTSKLLDFQPTAYLSPGSSFSPLARTTSVRREPHQLTSNTLRHHTFLPTSSTHAHALSIPDPSCLRVRRATY